MPEPINHGAQAGAIIAALVLAAGIVGAVVDSPHWLAWGLLVAWLFHAGTKGPG